MLASAQRLRRPGDINSVYSRGRYAAAGQLQVKVLKNNLAGSRIVVVVSKKVSKKAVVRNRLRRRISAQIAQIWPKLYPGHDIVVTVRQDISAQPVAELNQQLTSALLRGGVMQG